MAAIGSNYHLVLLINTNGEVAVIRTMMSTIIIVKKEISKLVNSYIMLIVKLYILFNMSYITSIKFII